MCITTVSLQRNAWPAATQAAPSAKLTLQGPVPSHIHDGRQGIHIFDNDSCVQHLNPPIPFFHCTLRMRK